jgi:hypothetical protein
MNTEFDDGAMIDELRSGFDGVSYQRPVQSMRPRSRTPFIAGAVAVSAVIATVVVVGGDGARSPALAWSPTPATTTTADEAAARAACEAGGNPAVGSTAIQVSGMAVATAAGSSGTIVVGNGVVGNGVVGNGVAPGAPPEGGTIVVSAGSGEVSGPGIPPGGTVVSGNGPLPNLPPPPATLPPLVSLDLRGSGGLAVFADKDWTMTCMLVKSGSGFEAGPIMAAPTDHAAADGTFAITSGSGAAWGDGKSVAMVSGTAPKGSSSVRLDLPGQPSATTNVVDGRFSIWWFGKFDPSKGSLTALDANGAIVGSLSPMLPGAPTLPSGTPQPIKG